VPLKKKTGEGGQDQDVGDTDAGRWGRAVEDIKFVTAACERGDFGEK